MENVLNGVESIRKNRHNYMISNIYTLKAPEYFGFCYTTRGMGTMKEMHIHGIKKKLTQPFICFIY